MVNLCWAFWYYRANYEILIRTLRVFLNKSIWIIMDHCSNEISTGWLLNSERKKFVDWCWNAIYIRIFAEAAILPYFHSIKNEQNLKTQEINCYDWINHHHHHVVLVARISLTLSRHFSLSFIASGRSSGQHPVSSHSCWMYVRAGRPAFARPCMGVHKSTSLMSSSLLLQQCPACLVRLTWIVFVIGGRWPYSWCLVGCCRQDLSKIARSILV